MANYGRHDPQTGLPMRVLDFSSHLATIVDAAISQKWTWSSLRAMRIKNRSPRRRFNARMG
ncbi:hypothetical protein [Candidatus Villigracilis affinis]|uniref:hypothetical protein n=1 Tax=Candidatus Villigracilis affinis TaxID=3140682 RepID=UPI002A1EA0F3|nr:hypothetical protein [Anaerolineales bacterium]